MTYRRLSLIDLKVKIQRGARTKTAAAAWEASNVAAAWRTQRGQRSSQQGRGRLLL